MAQPMYDGAVPKETDNRLCGEALAPVRAEIGILDFRLYLTVWVNDAAKANGVRQRLLLNSEHAVPTHIVVCAGYLQPLNALFARDRPSVTNPSHSNSVTVHGQQRRKIGFAPAANNQAFCAEDDIGHLPTFVVRPNGMELTGGPLRRAQPPHAGRPR